MYHMLTVVQHNNQVICNRRNYNYLHKKRKCKTPDGVSVIERGTCGLADFQTVGNTGQGSPGAVGGGSSGGGFGGGPITGPDFGGNSFNDIPTPGSPGVVQGPQTTYNIK